jgi:hypothetical protein
MSDKPQFLTVVKSELLGEFIWVHRSGGAVFFQSRINYTPEELKIMHSAKPELTKLTHEVKKMFSGKNLARVVE